MFIDRQLYDTMEELRTPLVIDRTSEAYMRMSAAGFKVHKAYKIDRRAFSSTFNNSDYRVEFECVCGRVEILTQNVIEDVAALHYHYTKPEGWDAALDIERVGAVSEEHLREDGFSETDIRRIRFVYDMHEELNALRAITGIDYRARKEQARVN